MRACLPLLLALSGCVWFRPAPVRTDTVTNLGSVPPPRCADAVWAAARTLTPCEAARPLGGTAVWYAKPFDCGWQMVWGCSDIRKVNVEVSVALPPTGHASDSALPEEIAHWVWAKCFPTVKTEWREPDPVTGKTLYLRDPDFQRWYGLVGTTARAACP